MELMSRARDLGNRADRLLRSQHNRRLPGGAKLRNPVGAVAPMGEIRFTMPSRHGQKARPVRQYVGAHRVELPDGEGGKVAATCIIAREKEAPADVAPAERRLLTNREVGSFKAAAELIDCYRARWEIELFFNVLKNGCRVEALQVASVEKLERALALFMVVAWRIARLTRLGRTCPEPEAELLFDRDECQAAYILMKKRRPKKPPRLKAVARLIAMHGGFLGRKGNGEPGVKTIWQGLQRIADVAQGLRWAQENHAV